MDSHEPTEDASKKTLDAPPPASAVKPAPLPPNPSPPSADPTTDDDATGKGGAPANGDHKPSVPLTSASTGAATDLEKKMRRAERFGMSVVMSEEEKRNTRAERYAVSTSTRTFSIFSLLTRHDLKIQLKCALFVRFGTGPVPARGGGTGQLEEQQKRKARAERYNPIFLVEILPFY